MSIKSADDDIEENRLTRESAQDLVDEIIRKYGREISAQEVLHEHEELRQFRSCVVDLAYEEYANAREQGLRFRQLTLSGSLRGSSSRCTACWNSTSCCARTPRWLNPSLRIAGPARGRSF